MKKMMTTIVATGLALALWGCSQQAPDSHEGHAHASATPKAAQTVSITPTPGQKVEVAAAGTEFDPAVPLASIPDGSWACVMDDKVHYAAGEKGEGKCTVCGMKLVQTGGEK